MFQVFNCTDGGSGNLIVQQQPSVYCGSDSWNKFVAFDSVMIFFYLFLVPGWVVRQFYYSKKTGKEQISSSLIAPMCQSYRSGCEYFELLRLCFRVGFVLIRDTFPLAASSKILFLTLLLLSQIWLESEFRPYAEHSQQSLSLLWEMMCILLLVSFPGLRVNEKNAFGACLVLFCVLIAGWSVFHAVQTTLKLANSSKENTAAV
eukprot:TRINITY_DN21972_c0_g1_i1.p1 TRINITY_DN21972_c0_g1~~TRINITY_DN21972_c0_g1_i1.p1  ORF type:complete len:204 (-),score=33.88 TRINITY_DN21972_c0_g1_i1:72-683(-)